MTTLASRSPAAPPRQDPPAGGDETFRALYAEHGPALLRFAISRPGRDRYWAEDIVQETFLRAWRHRDRLGATPVRAWLFKVAQRIMIDDSRRRAARVQEVAPADQAEPSTDDTVDRTLSRLVISEALSALPAAHRQVIIEMHLHGHSVPEIAKLLGIPPGTVKSRSYYGMRRLRLTLQESRTHTAA
jgi:RNA polymerase sigma-70 factor (ECF subfamily)